MEALETMREEFQYSASAPECQILRLYFQMLRKIELGLFKYEGLEDSYFDS
jgi:hypothetical protein